MGFPFDGREIATDARGYLLDRADWSRALAEAMAAADGITLSAEHWEVIDFVRAYHDEYAMAPPMRLLVKALAAAHGAEKAESRHLYRLFPDGPAKQACRYAGLPRPVSCI
jgi:tRNA 2-thiouridine synthesizing protein E